MRRFAVRLLLVAAPLPALAQNVPVTTLTKPAAEFPEGLAKITSMSELPDGRLMVIEFCQRIVELLDFRSGELSPVSRTGSGPGEYRTPISLFPVGDSTLLYDAGNMRYLVLGPDAKPVRTFGVIPSVTAERGGTVFTTSAFNPSASDRLGRLYSREGGIRAGPSGMERMDSVALERWNYATGKRDTVAFHRLLGKPGPITLDQRSSSPAFETGIQWTVGVDGTVALVDPKDYRVDFIAPDGKRTAGPPNAFTALRVTEAHKKEYLATRGPICGTGPMTITGADGKSTTAVVMAAPPPSDWVDVLPPFLSGQVKFAPDGMLWIRRTTEAGAPHTFDLIGPAGRVVHRVVLQKGSQLLGFGRSSVYVVRKDDDDLEFVQRYPLPAADRR